MEKQSKKAVKALAVSMFAVGFVTPLLFSNIVEAANFGAGETRQWLSDAVLNKTDATKWATTTGTADANYVVFHGVKFKIVAVDDVSKGQNAKVTLWSYDTSLSTSAYTSDGSWGSNVDKAYANSGLKTAMDNLYFTTFASDSRIQEVTLAGETISSTSIAYQEKDTTDTIKSYVWAPSYTEVMNAGTWGFSSDDTTAKSQRVVGDSSWLRSPYPALDNYAYRVYYDGRLYDDYVDSDYLLRPALQILNQTSYVFTTNVTIPTNGVFTANGSGTATSYALNNTATIVPTFTPATDGVILDGTKIGIKTTDKSSGTYAMAGLLTEEADSAKNDTWANLNGPSATSTKGISYMAQVSSNELDLSGVTAGTDYTLKVFGLKTADTAVTELANNAVQGLSKGSDSKIHMKIGGTYNNGVPVTLTNGASADLAGAANNSITVTGTGENGGCLGGEGTLTGEVKGTGTLTVTGTITAAADRFTQTGGLSGGLKVNKNLIFTSSGLNVSTIGGFTQASGSNITVDASKIEADSNDPAKAMFTGVDDASKLDVSAGNLTLTGTVQEGKYYVLVAGDVVGTTLTKDNLWKLDNIKVEGLFNVEYNTNLTGNSIAIQVTNATTYEEGNTSGLAAVQQSHITVAKEFTGEVENHLGIISRPPVKEKDRAKVRNVASTVKDEYKVETVEQGKANEIMPVQVAEKDKYDKEVWASYIRTKETTEGMKLEGIEGNNTAQYNGTVVGVDFYSSKKAIAGMALSYTTGDIDSFSGTTSTRNKSKYYGISFYDRVTNGNTALIYDIGYIRGNNDISQFNNAKETTADVKTNNYTAGVRYENEINLGKSRLVPFASFRYMRQNNGDYTNSHGTKFETKNQNLYIPKVGIAWTGDFIMPKSVWTWRPSVEAGYVWNLGDRTADSNVLMGTRPAAIEYDTVDKSSYYAKLGMEFMCKNFTAGLFYRYLKGSAVRNNKWNVNVAWSF